MLLDFINRMVRHLAVNTMMSSENAPRSNNAASENFVGAIKTTRELSEVLDESLRDFEFRGDWSERLKKEIERLQREVEKYSNGNVEELEYGTDWSCSQTEAQVICLAAHCAASAYDTDVQPWAQGGLSLERMKYINPTIDGTIKATSFTVGKEVDEESSQANTFLPALLVAVRGTNSVVDHMVNSNKEGRSAREFLVSYHLPSLAVSRFLQRLLLIDCFTKGLPDIKDLKAHAGFLKGAIALGKQAFPQLELCLATSKAKHVIFTGHSAGGATAALLFMHYLTRIPEGLQVSCITFGAPPVTMPDLTEWIAQHLQNMPKCGLLLAFANERDLVPRVDGDYIRSLVNLYRKSRGLPQLDLATAANSPPAAVQQDLQVQNRPESQGAVDREIVPVTPQDWPLPKPNFYNFGKLIVSRNATPNSDFMLRPVSVLPEEFGKLIYCDIHVHSRRSYVENAEELLHKVSIRNEEIITEASG